MNPNVEQPAPAHIPVGMKPGRREFREASLTVSVPTSLPAHMHAGTREITQVFVEPHARRQRQATILMNFVCQEADANRMTLILSARDFGGDDEARMDEAQLIAWYERFGFVKLQDTPTGMMMARQVREKPRVMSVREAVRKVLH